MKLETVLQTSPTEANETDLRCFLYGSLWGNQIDLSMAAGKSHEEVKNSYHADVQLASQTHLLVDSSQRVIDYLLSKQRKSEGIVEGIVHFILDNAGAELFMDLCLADY